MRSRPSAIPTTSLTPEGTHHENQSPDRRADRHARPAPFRHADRIGHQRQQAGDTFARLLAARIRDERGALAFTSILTADTFEQAEARLTLVLDFGNPEPAGEPIPAEEERP